MGRQRFLRLIVSESSEVNVEMLIKVGAAAALTFKGSILLLYTSHLTIENSSSSKNDALWYSRMT